MIKSIRPGVVEISLAWSNAYLLMDGGRAALIDSGLQKDRADLLLALQKAGVTPAQLEAIYLTHAHCDHAGNVAYLAQGRSVSLPQSLPRVYAHRDEVRYVALPRCSYVPHGARAILRPHTAVAFAACEWLYPVERCPVDVPLSDGDRIDAPGGTLRVVACPGHTAGHVAYFREQDGLLFSGDAIMHIIPVKRVTGLSLPIPMFSEDMALATQSARRLAELEPDLLLSGHGWPLQKDTARKLKAWADALR